MTIKTKSVKPRPLSDCVNESLDHYFEQMGDHLPTDLYKMVLKQMEKPLLEKVMVITECNQVRAAEVLGMNRATLRKKLALYDICSVRKK